MKPTDSENTAKKKSETVLKDLRGFGSCLYDQMEEGKFPWVEMPSRSTENIYYSPDVRQYILGEKSVKRNARNIRHIKPFTQMVWAGFFASELVKNRKTSTLRDVYYSAQA
jgi:DNA topoisomerase VI subunit A